MQSRGTPSRRKRGGRSTRLKKNQEIESVITRETFQFDEPNGEHGIGEGAYITAEINSRRYYGVLVDQDSLRAASILHLQDEASGLDLNNRMEALLSQKQASAPHDTKMDRQSKRQKLQTVDGDRREVQKFRFVPGSAQTQGYRVLLATYIGVEAAAEGSDKTVSSIRAACEQGGDFVGDFYYQYQLPDSALQVTTGQTNPDGVRLSLPMDRFLKLTSFPEWYPLSNNNGIVNQSKALGMLNLRQKRGFVRPMQSTETKTGGLISVSTALQPMEDRSRFRVCVVGGGIAGLQTCIELFRLCDREKIDVDVVLLEGRDRLGGRVHTDSRSLALDDQEHVQIELGASWIHGTENNPIMSLACEAGVSFVNANEHVQMLQSGIAEVDPVVDDKAGELFDELLDTAAVAAWENAETASTAHPAIRWYASNLCGPNRGPPTPSMTPDHRRSNDTSVDEAIATSILKSGFSALASVSNDEKCMLQWYTKNVEHAVGANIADLSMKYWDIDDRHAFEGGDVLLKEGYYRVVQRMLEFLTARGECFQCMLNNSVSRIEYHCRSTTRKHPDFLKKARILDLSDSCCVTTDKHLQIKSDFVVCAVPLGVLKASIEMRSGVEPQIVFDPSLPDVKQDAISSVGFGILNKIFLRFDCAFWRTIKTSSEDRPIQFGNASKTYPHHYMFVDVGAAWKFGPTYPPVLMSLVSGKQAADCEVLGDEEVVQEVVDVLRELFGERLGLEKVPNPVSYAITRWGSDEFSRGSFTFLPPGATDDDLMTLQTPVNGNGDSVLLEGSEIMRLFFAGEHTTSLATVTHGALLSGSRAAIEIVDTMLLRYNDQPGFDKAVPMAHYRKLHPNTILRCSFCGREGSTMHEGKLLAFKKGSRYILCHNNCAEFSPEVEVTDGKWHNVFTALNRSKAIQCIVCGGEAGASIGCSKKDCKHSVHYSCGEDTGWRFEKDGKEFFCSSHRQKEFDTSRRISLAHFVSHMGSDLRCVLCGQGEVSDSMRAFIVPGSVAGSSGSSMVALHSLCAKYTNVVLLEDDSSSALECDYANVGAMMDAIKVCSHCGNGGATIGCSHVGCSQYYHYMCAKARGCLGRSDKDKFFCRAHDAKAFSTVQTGTLICTTNMNMLSRIPDFRSDKHIPLGEASESSLNRVEVTIKRVSFADNWSIKTRAIKKEPTKSWSLYIANGDNPQLRPGDFLVSLNGLRIGTGNFASLEGVVNFMNSCTQVKLTVERS